MIDYILSSLSAYQNLEVDKQISTDRIIVILLYVCSGTFSLVIFVIGLMKKFHHLILSEFMMYLILGEIINSYSKILSIFRDNPKYSFENFDSNNLFKVIQLYIGIFVDTCTIFTTFVISLKIYDGMVLNTKIFQRKGNKTIARALIIIVPSLMSIILGTIHMFTYTIPITGTDKLCDLISCRVDDYILMIEYAIFICFILVSITIIILTLVFLTKKQKEITRLSDNEGRHSDLMKSTMKSITLSKFRLYIFPFLNIIIWMVFMVYSICVQINEPLKRYYYPIPYLWCYSIFHGLRSLLYSLLFIFINKDLMAIIFCCKCQKDKNLEINNDNDNANELAKNNEYYLMNKEENNDNEIIDQDSYNS